MNVPERIDLDEALTAVIDGVVPMAEIAGFFDRSFAELASVLGRQGLPPTGPAFARYAGPPGESADIQVGFPVGGAVAPEGRVRPSALPAGPVLRLVHAGSYEGLGEAWGRLAAWIAEQGLSPGSDIWEIYVTEPNPEMDPGDLRTELFWTLRT